MSDSVNNLNQVMAALQQLQQENEILRESLRELQNGTSNNPPPTEPRLLSTPSTTPSSSHPYVLEPSISPPDKFNGSRVCLCVFINQIWLIICLPPQRSASDFSRVGLGGTLLTNQGKSGLHHRSRPHPHS